ncbi:uroporphyrinogen-III synthase [Mesorhizobium sp. KR9-304]|uniref:uroporphyrinogen-III synthase n=1 Tax=Mesorhizobium sp. KR9-304 TaxID=3156614 RepID=UPI0032B33182
MAGAPKRVLVTRPEPGASETARRLETLGFDAHKLPLHEIRTLPVDAGVIPDDVATVAITSANAIRHAPQDVINRLKHLPCFAVGASTARSATDAGFSNVIAGGGDAEGLAETIAGRRPSLPLAYLCGRVRRPAFEKRLAHEGIPIHAVETYDTVGLSYTAEEVLNLTTRHPIDFALVYSANAAEILAATIRRPQLENLFENTLFACISDRVAQALGGWPRGRIRIAREPSETALLYLLGHTADGAP